MKKEDVGSVSLHQILSGDVQEYLTEKAVILPLVLDFTAQVEKGATQVSIPRLSGLAVTDVVESDDDTADGTMDVDADVLLLNKFVEVKKYFYESAVLSSTVDLQDAFFANAPKIYAEGIELALWAELKASASASGPDHIIQMTGAGNNSPTIADVANCQLLLDIEKVDSDRYIICGPVTKIDFLKLQEIQDASRSGSNMALTKGMFAEIHGFKMVFSNVIGSEKGFVAMHKTALAFARNKQLEAINEAQRSKGRVFCSARGGYGVKGLDAGKRVVWYNTTGVKPA